MFLGAHRWVSAVNVAWCMNLSPRGIEHHIHCCETPQVQLSVQNAYVSQHCICFQIHCNTPSHTDTCAGSCHCFLPVCLFPYPSKLVSTPTSVCLEPSKTSTIFNREALQPASIQDCPSVFSVSFTSKVDVILQHSEQAPCRYCIQHNACSIVCAKF